MLKQDQKKTPPMFSSLCCTCKEMNKENVRWRVCKGIIVALCLISAAHACCNHLVQTPDKVKSGCSLIVSQMADHVSKSVTSSLRLNLRLQDETNNFVFTLV